MQIYQCHKQVHAAQIVHIDHTRLLLDGGLDDDGNAVVKPVMVSLDFIEKHKPASGDYFVQYEDGYQSISPASAFEGGYTAIDDGAAPTPAIGEPVAMRAKMRINNIDTQFVGQEGLSFIAVSKSEAYPEDGYDENNTYAKFSPSGSLSLTVANPNLLGKFKVGEEYYLDFTKAKAAPLPVEKE